MVSQSVALSLSLLFARLLKVYLSTQHQRFVRNESKSETPPHWQFVEREILHIRAPSVISDLFIFLSLMSSDDQRPVRIAKI